MKRFLVSISCMAGVALLIGCGTTMNAEKAAEQAAMVRNMLSERHYRIGVNFMYPFRGSSRSLTSDYFIEVRNDSLISHLPYFGEAYDLPYGGGQGLNFSERIGSYADYQKKKDEFVIEIGVKNSEDIFIYTINVFDNGRSSIDVRSRKRDPISFSGEMEF